MGIGELIIYRISFHQLIIMNQSICQKIFKRYSLIILCDFFGNDKIYFSWIIIFQLREQVFLTTTGIIKIKTALRRVSYFADVCG